MMKRWLAGAACVAAVSGGIAGAGVFYPDGARTLHFAFEGSPNSDRPVVRPPAIYHPEDGFGFVDSPGLVGNAVGVQAPQYFRFDVNLPPGNYNVTVRLGGAGSGIGGVSAPTVATIRAEGHRAMVLDAAPPPGGRAGVEKTFTVNVRRGELGPNPHDGWLDLDDKLTLEFSGTNPALMKLDVKPNESAATVYLAGDSTVCDQDNIPFAGWGQMLPLFFKPGEVAVANRARSGRSAKSFAGQDLADIKGALREGDFLLIQFGTNDLGDRTLTADSWKAALKAHVDAAREKKATPVLISAMSRREFDAAGKPVDTMKELPTWMRELAAAEHVAYIDLNAESQKLFAALGPEGSKAAFVHYPAGAFSTHPEELHDDVHFNPYGAFELAKIVVRGLRANKVPLADRLNELSAEMNADPAKFPASLGYPYLQKK
jgi:lysophospholipase L1-like esterase